MSGQGSMNRRAALGYGGAVVAGAAAPLLGGGQAAAAEAEPAALPTRVGSARTQRIIEAGMRYVREHPGIPPMYFYVVDESGNKTASRRMEGNSPASLTLVPIKAKTAAAFRTATADLATRTTDPGRIASITTAGFSLLPGGRPIADNGTVIGALGVGGGTPEQDDEVARAALQA